MFPTTSESKVAIMRIGLCGAGRIGAFHAETLQGLEGVDAVVIEDARPDAARAVADRLGLDMAEDVPSLLDRVDALVVASPTNTHAELIRAGIAAGLPVFCEKPVAGTLEESVELAELEQRSDVPVQIGFQRRFDHGYRRAHDAVRPGGLGAVHTVRACSLDNGIPPEEYIRVSGGLFRDCNIHDFDAIRYVTGEEVVTAYAVGSNKGPSYIADAGDIDTGMGIFTMSGGTLVTFSGGRLNGFGHDVRMEVHGTTGDLAVGMDESMALTSAEQGVAWPTGPTVASFMDRFHDAYAVELAAFLRVAAGQEPSPCTIGDALQAIRMAVACDWSRERGTVVRLDEVPGAHLVPESR